MAREYTPQPLEEREVAAIKRLGLTEYEARIYLTLFKMGPKKASEIGFFARVPRTKITKSIRALEEMGLLQISRGEPKYAAMYAAVSPEVLLSRVSRRMSELRDSEEIIERLDDLSHQFYDHDISESRELSRLRLLAWPVRLAWLALPFVAAVAAGLLLGVSTGSLTPLPYSFAFQPLVVALVAGLLSVVAVSSKAVWKGIKKLVGE